jgi:hypothetical protein
MPTLTDPEWRRVAPLLKNIEVNRQQAAYNRLVLGMTLVQSGESFGYSKQDVNIICKAVMKWWDKLNSIPDKPLPPRGWVAVEFFVPRAQVDEVRRVVEALCPQPKAAPAKKSKSRSASGTSNPRTSSTSRSKPKA